MITNIRAITASSFLSMFFLGVGAAIIGAAARNIGLTAYQIGLMMSIQNLGFMLAVMITGALSDTFEKPKLLFAGSFVLAVSFFTFYLNGSFMLNLFIMFFIGIGLGSYEGVTDVMLMDIHKEKESLYININHFFVTFGALMITLYLLFLQMNWRKSITQSAIVVFLLAVFFLLARLRIEKKGVEKLSARLRFLRGQKTVGVLFIATICTVGLEMGSVGILTTFLMELRSFNQVTSKIGLIIFLSGIATGRILVGTLTKKQQIFNNIMLLFGMSTILFSCVYFINAGIITYILIYLAGITVSSLLPLIITLAGLTYIEMSGTVIGIIKLALPVGGILIPFMLSLLSKYVSLQIALLLFPIIAGLSFIILFMNRKIFRSKIL